ncbi:lipocalin-like 1 protein [Trichosurus vulpecula]|uniref:lipocalin-like 1 protein n=1 Tax=Trichosurus vulpecula TaxID=9337 RepID=UPI00186B0F7E|nr:lipocalin-like 1 protein [Trichosurus vulpecula]
MMKAVLLGCLLGLLWGSPIQADVPLQGNFDNSKGLWYITAAASDDEDFLAMKETMKMPITFVTPLANGDLSVKTVFPAPGGGCQIVDATFTKGAMPGQFRNPDMGQEDISVLSSDYQHYAILRIMMNKGGVQRVMMQLYCRSPELFAEGVQRMQMLAPKLNLNPSQGAIFPKSDECDKVLTKMLYCSTREFDFYQGRTTADKPPPGEDAPELRPFRGWDWLCGLRLQ